MYEVKTKPSGTDVLDVIRAIPSESKHADARVLSEMICAAQNFVVHASPQSSI